SGRLKTTAVLASGTDSPAASSALICRAIATSSSSRSRQVHHSAGGLGIGDWGLGGLGGLGEIGGFGGRGVVIGVIDDRRDRRNDQRRRHRSPFTTFQSPQSPIPNP